MLAEFNPIIIDVIVCVLAISIIVLGALKGIKHTSINFVLLAGSVALGFAPFMADVKKPIIKLLADKINLGAGVTDEVKLALYLSYELIVSLILAIALFIVLRLIKLFIMLMVKHNAKRNNKLIKRPNKISRITGAIVSLVLNGVVLVLVLSIFNHPLIGGNKTVEKTYVSKYVEVADDEVLKIFFDDEKELEDKVLVKLIKGDLYGKVSDEAVNDVEEISKLTNGVRFSPTDVEHIDVPVANLKHALHLLDELALNDEGEVVRFTEAIDLLKNMATKSVNEMKALKGDGDKLTANDTMAVYNLLKKFKLDAVADTFEETFVIS